ncbi:MAG: DUF115 domain-containing protein [Treponema sp.]|nr:DUF115 domain-containing protein [Treponema sp.]
MNSIWNKNISLFEKRFPSLFNLLQEAIQGFSKLEGSPKEKDLYPFWKIIPSKTNEVTVEEKGIKLHSAYNPIKESQNLLLKQKDQIESSDAIVFMGMGLGYTFLEAAKNFPEKQFILVEPDPNHFLAALLFLDFEKVFSCPKLILAVSCPPDQLMPLINQNSLEKTLFISVKAHEIHAEKYFSSVHELIERNKAKEKINQATLKKFEKLWRNNCRKNAPLINSLRGVNCLKDRFKDLPFLLLAAGPTLEEILPHLEEIKERCKIICVDTALKACLRQKVEPDFIILTDPQYWAYRHIAGLASPSSTLITEIAAYPAVFRFKCKEILLCDSQVPMAKEYSSIEKGNLGSGGSVASSAFNFCIYSGAKEIYTAGLDFAFPEKQTHIKGSTFEESIHRSSLKNSTAETKSLPLLFNGNVTLAQDYDGKPILTDKKMKMFAWWFESRIAEVPDVKVYSLSAKGIKIPGIEVSSVKNLLNKSKLS